MLRAWRRCAIAALVTGAAVAAQLTGVTAAHASATPTPTITIAATTKLKPVTGDQFVIFHLVDYNIAKLHGTIANATAGEVAELYAQPFPFTKPPVRIRFLRLKAATTAYSFTVTPTLVTHYAMRLFANGTSTALLATSRMQPLYVTSEQQITNQPQQCARPVCHEKFRVNTYVPWQALAFEMGKHMNPYFGLTLGTSKVPPEPKWLYLNAAHGHATKSRRLGTQEFQNILSFSFTIGADSYSWIPAFCTKDAVTKDGIGLPGSHGCGANRVSSSLAYLG